MGGLLIFVWLLFVVVFWGFIGVFSGVSFSVACCLLCSFSVLCWLAAAWSALFLHFITD